MLFSSSILLAAAVLTPHVAGAKNFKTIISTPSAFQAASANSVTSNVLTLTKKKSTKGYNPRSAAWLTNKPGTNPTGHSTTLISLFTGEEFATTITFGTETFEVSVDTGSSDTWLAETGFKCVNITTSAPLPEADCAFGPTYNVTNTFKKIANENFNITYGDGEFLTGIVGTEEVTLAGLKVKQEVALVNFAAWEGDGTTSGLVGLAYPSLTSAYAGSNPTLDNSPAGEQIVYNPIFTTMYKDGLIPPLFSLAILRDVSGPSGYLSLGGLPPVDCIPGFTSTPILITTIEGYPKTYDFYTININGVVLGGKTVPGSGGDIQYIVDSGTTLNYFPTAVADAINAAFVPPAVFDDDEGAYVVDCKAKAPTLGIKINGTTFGINPLDMILLAGTDENGNNVCISGIDDGGDDPTTDVYILGDTFQKNVVSVFDIGAVEMRFASREYYPSNDDFKA